MYERRNPEHTDEEGLKARVRQYFTMCLCCLRHFPEIWYDVVEFELAANDEERALKVYSEVNIVGYYEIHLLEAHCLGLPYPVNHRTP